jgi:hypothetical protein
MRYLRRLPRRSKATRATLSTRRKCRPSSTPRSGRFAACRAIRQRFSHDEQVGSAKDFGLDVKPRQKRVVEQAVVGVDAEAEANQGRFRLEVRGSNLCGPPTAPEDRTAHAFSVSSKAAPRVSARTNQLFVELQLVRKTSPIASEWRSLHASPRLRPLSGQYSNLNLHGPSLRLPAIAGVLRPFSVCEAAGHRLRSTPVQSR